MAQSWVECWVVTTAFHWAAKMDVQSAARWAGLWAVCLAGSRVAMTAVLTAER